MAEPTAEMTAHREKHTGEIAGVACPPGRRTTVILRVGSREDGSALEIALLVLTGTSPGPTLLVTGLLHGTEITGAEVIRRLLEVVDPSALAGRIVAVPVSNPLAFLAHSQTTPRDGLNMNRVFPGEAEGSITHRMAHRLASTCLPAADAVIDIHTNSYPAVHWVIAKTGGDELGRRTEAMAEAFGLTVGRYSRARERQLVGTLIDAALNRGIPGIIVELTAHTMLLPAPIAVGVRGTLNVMKVLGMLSGEPEQHDDVALIPGGFTTNNRLRASAGGLVHHVKSPGDWVASGDVVAEIRTPLGDLAEEVRSPAPGFILSFPRYHNQAVMTGDHVVFIASQE